VPSKIFDMLSLIDMAIFLDHQFSQDGDSIFHHFVWENVFNDATHGKKVSNIKFEIHT
jgi:hypothetical protein